MYMTLQDYCITKRIGKYYNSSEIGKTIRAGEFSVNGETVYDTKYPLEFNDHVVWKTGKNRFNYVVGHY